MNKSITKMDFKFQLNLQRLAKHSYAVLLWEREDIRAKMKEYFYKNNRVKTEDDWPNITKSVIELLDPATLPLILYNEMIYIVREVGLKIFDWFNSLKCMSLFSEVNRKRLYDVYLQKIYWTYYGTINVLRNFKSWMDIPDIDSFIIYNMACLYCLEDEIPTLWAKIPRKIRRNIKACRSQFYGKYGYYILAYWLANEDADSFSMIRFNRAISREEGDFERSLDADQSPEANMFVFSARKGYRIAVEYFWENISLQEQEKNLVIALSWALRVIGSRNWCKQYHRKEQYIETCIFLMKKLDQESMKKVIKHKFKETPLFGTERQVVSQNVHHIIDLFINIWPWQEFFMTAFNMVKPYLTGKNYRHIFQVITYYMSRDHEYGCGYSVRNIVYQRMLHAVWREMPDNMKSENVIQSAEMENLFRSWDLTSIKMILNDHFINEMRADLMKHLFHNLINLLDDNQTEKVDEFIEEVLSGDNKENKIYKLIVKDDFDSLEELQNSYSTEELKKIKSWISTEGVCHFLIAKNELDLADKFLNWVFDKQSQIDHFKFKFKENEFSRKHIYRIWIKSNERTAEELSEKFIKWFVKTPEELESFKKNEIVLYTVYDYNYDSDEEESSFKFYKPFLEVDRYEMVLPLLKWCGFDDDYIKKNKKNLVDDDRISYFIGTNRIEATKKFLKWAFDADELRTDHVRCVVNSKKGFSGCKKFIASSSGDKIEDLTEPFKKFISFWIQPTGSVKRVKKKLIAWKEKLKKLDENLDESEDEWDPWSTREYREPSDISLNFDRNEIYCPEEKINMFLSVLNGFESGDDPKAEDNDDYSDENSSTSSSRDMSGSSYELNFSEDEEEDDEEDEDEDDDEEVENNSDSEENEDESGK